MVSLGYGVSTHFHVLHSHGGVCAQFAAWQCVSAKGRNFEREKHMSCHLNTCLESTQYDTTYLFDHEDFAQGCARGHYLMSTPRKVVCRKHSFPG